MGLQPMPMEPAPNSPQWIWDEYWRKLHKMHMRAARLRMISMMLAALSIIALGLIIGLAHR